MRKEKEDALSIFCSVLVSIFLAKQHVLGKVDLQKSVYFAKRLSAPIPFDFRWNILGPYSYELAHYVDHLVIEGLLRYSGIYKLNREMAEEYEMDLNHETRRSLEVFFEELEENCIKKEYDPVLFIECAASLDFIHTNLGGEVIEKERIFRLLDELKAEKKASFANMREDVWNLLIKHNLVD